jgi:chaperonin GroES
MVKAWKLLTSSRLVVHLGGKYAMKVKPLSDRIVVKRQASAEKTTGGLYLPDSAKNKPQRGKVVAAGPGRIMKDGSRRGLQVKEGDTILFTNWAGEEYKSREDEILIMREEDVLAVLDD